VDAGEWMEPLNGEPGTRNATNALDTEGGIGGQGKKSRDCLQTGHTNSQLTPAGNFDNIPTNINEKEGKK